MKQTGLILLVGFAVILVAGFLFYSFSTASPVAKPALPNPNGYRDFQEAAKIVRRSPTSVSEMSVAELEAFVKAEENALRLLKSGLEKECAVPLEYSEAYIRLHLQSLAPIKDLSSLLNAEARLITTTNASAGARAYVDSIRFADGVGKGGLIIDHLIGLSCQHHGVKQLGVLKDRLNAEETRAVFDAVAKIYRRRQKAAEVTARDDEWTRRAGDLRTRLAVVIRPGLLRPVHQKYAQQASAGEAELKRLLLDYAARINELEKGTNSANLESLVRAL